MNKKFLFLIVCIVLIVLTVSGCTSQNQTGYTVTIQNMAFNPQTVYIQTGTTIHWMNKDSVTHRVVSDSGIFDSGELRSGQTYNYTFNKSGSYPYHCSIHSSMTGTIVVSAAVSNNTSNTVNPTTTNPTSTGSSNINSNGGASNSNSNGGTLGY